MSHRSVLHDEWSTGVHQLGGKADEGGDIAQCMQAVTRPARNRSLFLLFYATILDRFRRKYSFKCSTAAPRGVVIFLESRVRNSLGPFPSRRPRCKMAGRTQLRKRMAEWRVVSPGKKKWRRRSAFVLRGRRRRRRRRAALLSFSYFLCSTIEPRYRVP